MRKILVGAAATMLMVVIGCGPSESSVQRHEEANTPAGKVGKAAHAVAKESGKALDYAGRKLERAAHDAHEGWSEAEKNDRAKGKK